MTEPDLYSDLADIERRIRLLRERARGAGLLALDEALKVPHGALGKCVAHVAPADVPRWGNGTNPDRVWRGDDNTDHTWKGT